MDKKYLMNGLAALAIVAGISSCVKDVDGVNTADQEKAAKENAELQLGLNIPDGQTWEMSTQITANVSVDEKAGETYRVTVYSNNPLADGKGVFLTRGTINNGETFTGKFTCGSGVKSLYVGLTDSKGYTIYKQATVENNRLDLSFDNPSAGARRAYTIKGATYNQFTFPTEAEIAAAYPSAVPAGAEEVADLASMEKYNTQEYSNGNIWWIYSKNGAGHNYKVTKTGEATIGGGWANKTEGAYNVYVNVDGNVTLKTNGVISMNLYILKGNVTLDYNFAPYSGIFSVGSNATVNDPRKEIKEQPESSIDGIKVFNRGTYNAPNDDHFELQNKVYFYNEGTVSVKKDLRFSAGAGNPSYFYNIGDDSELTAASVTFNSTCNFITNGTVNISGETKVTKDEVTWVNNGKYTTNTMLFSSKNGTFYNYCQLIVKDVCKFLDGEFNMMQDSYAEFKYGMFDNFIVNMANNSGIQITDGTKWERQGQGTFQGFKAVDDDAVCYVRLGGNQYVPSHNGAAFHLQGKHLTAAISNMKFYNDYNGGFMNYSSFDGPNFWNETNAEALKGDGRITWDIHNASVANIESAKFAEIKAGECSSTWEEEEYETFDEPQVYSYAFEDQIYNGDYDMNDVVLKVTFPSTKNNKGEVIAIDSTKLQITMVAAGATFKIKAYVGDTPLFDGQEIHDAFGVNQGVMVNTGNNKAQTATPVVDVIEIPDGIIDEDGNADFSQLDIWIHVNDHVAEGANSSNQIIKYLTDKEKPTPYAIMIPQDWKWPLERICITEAYPGILDATKEGGYNTEFSFKVWAETPNAQRNDNMKEWFNHPVTGKVMTNSSNANSNN